MTPAEVIEMLKSEISRYEELKRTEEAWALLYRREDGARQTRDLFQLAFLAMEARAGRGDAAGVLEVAAFVRAEAMERDGALKPMWWHGRSGASEDPAPTAEVVSARSEVVRHLYDRFLSREKEVRG